MESDEKSMGARAMHWGVMTWVGNAAGCLVGMVPIALPLSIILTVVTLITGVWAMALGQRARGVEGISDEERRSASAGFWLGAAHVVIVLVLGVIVVLGMQQGIFKDLGVLPTE